jgi:glycyl-tRNA synthetase beta chain
VRRGNEWVIRGRLDDARFFWNEDRKRPLVERLEGLQHVVYMGRLGSYADKVQRTAELARCLARAIGLAPAAIDDCEAAARLCKCDLLTGLVGEFPELQGRVGGLLLAAEGRPERVARGVYEHYQPSGAEDDLPRSVSGAVVSVADKLDQIAGLIGIGETPSGSRDPFGLRRAAAGIFRIVVERGWALSLDDLTGLVGRPVERLRAFLVERLRQHVRELGYTANEAAAVLLAARGGQHAGAAPLPDIVARLEAIRTVRERADFAQLVQLAKRVDNILTKPCDATQDASPEAFEETEPAAVELAALLQRQGARLDDALRQRRYAEVVTLLAQFVRPVSRFFDEVLVIDATRAAATRSRLDLLERLRRVVLGTFDIRELAGQAEGRSE